MVPLPFCRTDSYISPGSQLSQKRPSRRGAKSIALRDPMQRVLQPPIRLLACRLTNDQNRTVGVPYYRFGDTAEQQPPHALVSARSKDDEVRRPVRSGVDDGLANVAIFDRRVHRIASGAELLRVFIDERARLPPLLFQFRGIATRHLRGSGEHNRGQNMHNSDFRGLWLEIIRRAINGSFRVFRIIDGDKNLHCSSQFRETCSYCPQARTTPAFPCRGMEQDLGTI